MKSIKKIVMYVTPVILIMAMLFVFAGAASKKPAISKKKLTLRVGQTYKLKVKHYSGKVKWKSKNKKIVKINKKGKITAKKQGKTKVIAIFKGKKKVCKVTVVPKNNNVLPEIPTTKASETATMPAITTLPETTIPEVTTEPATTETQETTAEEAFDREKYAMSGMHFYMENADEDDQNTYEHVVTYPKTEDNLVTYKIQDEENAWRLYCNLRGQETPLDTILSQLQSKGYISSNPISGGPNSNLKVKGEWFLFSYNTKILKYTNEDGVVNQYIIMDYDNAWKLTNSLLGQNMASAQIASQLKARGYIK